MYALRALQGQAWRANVRRVRACVRAYGLVGERDMRLVFRLTRAQPGHRPQSHRAHAMEDLEGFHWQDSRKAGREA